MEDKPSDRLVDQRIRNRIIEAVERLADGDDGARREWPNGYFDSFYDWIPHRDDGEMPSISTVSANERDLLKKLSGLLNDACDATPKNMAADELIATGWPKRIEPLAMQALNLMRQRGRFSEEHEEDTRSM